MGACNSKGIGVLLLGAFASLACSLETSSTASVSKDEAAVQPSPTVDVRRSLAITDQPLLVNFSFKRVMDQIVATSGIPGLTSLGLFQQWWDTQNSAATPGAAPHCNDTLIDGNPSLNGYPYTCRETPAEGVQATCDPFSDPNSPCAYIPVMLSMRFDLAPASGADCGEYRIVYAKSSGRTLGTDRNLVIFEATLRNPHVTQGIRGCERFVRAWAELSNENDIQKRRASLEKFYFTGFAEYDPVVQFSNFGDNITGVGQVRTNQFVQPSSPRIWSLREFKLLKQCEGANCTGRFVPVTNKTNPYGPLFNVNSAEPNAPAFQADFLNRVAGLAAPSLNGIGLSTPDVFNSGQSEANGTTETNYYANFPAGDNAFRSAIQGALTGLGSSLTPDEIVHRAQTMSCAGCHRISNNVALGGGLAWPPSLGFTHVSERDVDLEVVDGVTRYRISTALTGTLLPSRKQLVEDFLNNVQLPAGPPNTPIGGRWTH
jgi:hypothetical protein